MEGRTPSSAPLPRSIGPRQHNQCITRMA